MKTSQKRDITRLQGGQKGQRLSRKARNLRRQLLARTVFCRYSHFCSLVRSPMAVQIQSDTLLALAIVAYRLDDKAVSAYGDKVQDAMQLGLTIFPIAFAAIASKAVQSLARKLVERGEKIGILEQLLGSQSLAGTISWLIELHYLHIVGIAMIVVWALSPLGGQSALRLLSVQRNETLTTQKVGYIMLNIATKSWLSSSDALQSDSAIAAYYSTALLDAHQSKHQPVDIWGNPKIPLLDSFKHEGDGWWSYVDDRQTQYSSLIGVRLQGLCRDCNMTFPIETSYTELVCKNSGHQIPLNETMDRISFQYSGWFPSNHSEPFFGYSEQVSKNMSISSFLGNNHGFQDEISTILYVAKGWYDPESEAASIYNCTMETTRVESEVGCIEASCKVTRMRPSTIDIRSRNWTQFRDLTEEFFRFSLWFPFAAGYTTSIQSSATDNFIFGDLAPYNDTSPRDWRKVPDSELSQRWLSTLFGRQHTHHIQSPMRTLLLH
ncbi:hypothetical protein BKA63DRAFT_207905 [Paraphoma chrysanthemicola]|nr:hypothetical protein BKA63DRAFT_207905 [Paraphoma chrysanthemicola]